MSISHVISAFSGSPWFLLADAVAKATLILAVGALVSVALRHASAASRHLVWTLAILSALVLPALSVALPRWQLPIVTLSSTTPDLALVTDEPVSRPAPLLGIRGPQQGEPQPAAAGPGARRAPASAGLPWSTILLMVWGAGALAILARLAAGLLAVQCMSRRTERVTDAPWLPLARSLAHELGVSPRILFLRSGRAAMPMAWGMVLPSVLMPADADAWPAERLRIVLLHELAHVKRRDCLTHAIAQIACALYWFNPLVWVAAKHLRTERERACDDLVLAAGTRGADYADQLLEIARVMRSGRFPAVLAGASLAMAHRSQLEGRLMAILDPSVPRSAVSRFRTAAATALFAGALMPLASLQPWTYAAEQSPAAQAPASTAPAARVATEESADVVARRLARLDADIQNNVQSRVQSRVESDVHSRAEGRVHADVESTVQAGIQKSVQAGIDKSMQAGLLESVGAAVQLATDAINLNVNTNINSAINANVNARVNSDVNARVNANHHGGSDDARQNANRKGADPRMVEALTLALKDTDKEVRETALHALVQLRNPSIYEPLLQALKDASPDVREQAAHGLGQLRDRRAVEPLVSALKDSDADVREQAAFALGQLRDRTAIAGLTSALKDSSDSVREQAVFALGQLRDPASVEALATALRDTKPDVREQAAFSLGQIRDRRAVEPLISALKDSTADVREQAAFALGQIRDRGAVEALVIALKDAAADVREQVAFALGQIRDPRAIEGLTGALKDSSADVRQQAAFALGQLAR